MTKGIELPGNGGGWDEVVYIAEKLKAVLEECKGDQEYVLYVRPKQTPMPEPKVGMAADCLIKGQHYSGIVCVRADYACFWLSSGCGFMRLVGSLDIIRLWSEGKIVWERKEAR